MRQRFAIAILALVFLAGVPSILNAQNTIIGLKAGMTSSNISTDDPELGDTSARTGFGVGPFVQIGLSDVFAIQLEGNYVQGGFEADFDGVDAALELDYIQVPVLLKAMAGGSDATVRPGVFAGGAVAFETSCSITGEEAGISVDVDCDVEEGLEREKTDFGLIFGGEVQFDVGQSLVLLVDGRYYLGVRDLGAGGEDESAKGRAFAISAGAGIKVN